MPYMFEHIILSNDSKIAINIVFSTLIKFVFIKFLLFAFFLSKMLRKPQLMLELVIFILKHIATLPGELVGSL